MTEIALEGTVGMNPFPENAAAMREALDAGNHPPDLERVLELCWNCGVPVLYLQETPPKSSKPHAMIFRKEGRYAILLSRKLKHSAQAVFDILHEVGHSVLGHLPENGARVDQDIKLKPENQEEDANGFAVEVLTGNPHLRLKSDRWLNAEQLANAALSIGERLRIDPGVVALNYSWNAQFMPVAMASLNIIEPNADAVRTIRHYLLERLDWKRLTEENAEYLIRMTGGNMDDLPCRQ